VRIRLSFAKTRAVVAAFSTYHQPWRERSYTSRKLSGRVESDEAEKKAELTLLQQLKFHVRQRFDCLNPLESVQHELKRYVLVDLEHSRDTLSTHSRHVVKDPSEMFFVGKNILLKR